MNRKQAMSNYVVTVKVYFRSGVRNVDLIITSYSDGAATKEAIERTKEFGGKVVDCSRIGSAERSANYVAQLRNMAGAIKHVLVNDLESIRSAEKAVMRKIAGCPQYRGYRIVEIKETTV